MYKSIWDKTFGILYNMYSVTEESHPLTLIAMQVHVDCIIDCMITLTEDT